MPDSDQANTRGWFDIRFTTTQQYCVYIHSYQDAVFYVGKGTLSRPWERSSRNDQWKAYVDSIGGEYAITLVFITSEEAQALEIERALIRCWQPRCNILGKSEIPGVQDGTFPEDMLAIPSRHWVAPPASCMLSVFLPEPLVELMDILAQREEMKQDHIVERALTEYLGKMFPSAVETVRMLTHQTLRLQCIDMGLLGKRVELVEASIITLLNRIPYFEKILEVLKEQEKRHTKEWLSGLYFGIALGTLVTTVGWLLLR